MARPVVYPASMPVVFRQEGFRFLFYANEGNPREPIHIHVLRDGVDAKFWLWPDVRPAYNDGFSAKVLRELELVHPDWLRTTTAGSSRIRFTDTGYGRKLAEGRSPYRAAMRGHPPPQPKTVRVNRL